MAAADAVWTGSGAQPTNYSLSTNWAPSGPPSGTATFGPSAYYGTLAAPITGGTVFPGTWNFTTAPQTYYMQLAGGADAIFNGLGVVGSNANITVNEFVEFNGTATSMGGATYMNNNTLYIAQGTAGSSKITNTANGTLIFVNNPASAGTSTIANNGVTEFGFGSSASNSSINNTNQLYFFGSSSAGTSTITTENGGRTYFFYNPGDPAGQTPDGGSARQIVKSGGILDLSSLSDGSTCHTNGSACTGGTPPYGNAVAFTAGSIEGAGDIYLGANTLAAGSLNTNTEFSGVIHDGASPTAMADLGESPGGSGSLKKVGTGTLILSGNNTYTGGSTITAGTLQLGNGGVGGSILGNVANGGTLAFDRSDVFTFAGVISDNGGSHGNVTQIGSGTTILTGNNTYTGGTTIAVGTLQLGNGGASGSIVGNVVDNGVLSVNRSDNFSFGGVISGTGAFAQNGTGTTVLAGINSYAGTTTVNAGTLQAGTAGSFSSGSAFTVAGGAALDLNNFSQTIGSLAGAGNVTLGSAALTAGANNTSTAFSGILSGTGSLAKAGSGTLILTGNNTYTGGTTISGGKLQVGNGGTSGSIAGNVIDNGIFAVNRSDTLAFGGLISGTGAFQQNGSGTTILGSNNTYTGGTTIAAGTLQLGNGSASGSVVGNVVDNGILAVNRSDTFTVGGVISGTGAFTQNGTGTTVLAGVNSYAGTTSVSAGTLQAGAAGSFSSGSAFTVAGGAALDLNNYSQTIGSLAGAGHVTLGSAALTEGGNNASTTFSGILSGTGSLAKAGSGTLILTGNNTYTGGTTISGGKLQVGNGGTSGSIVGNVTDNGILAINRADAVTLGVAISGTGAFQQNGSGTTILTGSNAYTGATTIAAGSLVVNGSIASSNLTAVDAGGTLGGNGVVGNTVISGGTLAPGNDPGDLFGPLAVQGNLSFTAASTYMIQLTPANAGRTNVTGIATLGGATVTANFASGTYVSKQYTIVSATGGVAGTFSSLVNTNLPANFSANLSYDAHDAFLDLTLNFTPPPNSGLNQNRQKVANAIIGFFNANGDIPLVFGGLTPAGLTQVSGELATGSQQTTLEAMQLFMGVLTDPFIAGRSDPISSSTSTPGFAEEIDGSNAYAADAGPRPKSERDAYAAIYPKAPVIDTFTQRWSVWAAGFGGSQATDGNAALGSNTTTSRIYGTAVGADYRFSPNTRAGFALAGAGANFSIANGLGGGRSDLFQAGGYLRHHAGPAYISAALAYGWQDTTTDRTVTIAGVDRLRAEFNANAFSGRLEGGYRFLSPWMATGVTPYAAVQFTTFDLPAYAEQILSGANTFALTYGSKSVTASRSELGIRTDKSWAMRDGIFTLRGRFAWAHDFNTDRNIVATFQALPGASFVVNGAAQAHEAALTTASAEMKWLNGWSAVAAFEGEFSSITRSYAGKGILRYAW